MIAILGTVGAFYACDHDAITLDEGPDNEAGQIAIEGCGSEFAAVLEYEAQFPDAGVNSTTSHSAPPIGINATHFYYLLQWDSIPSGPGAHLEELQAYLMRVPLEGGEPERVVSIPLGTISSPQAMALSNEDAMVIENSHDAPNGMLLRVPLDGSSSSVVAEATGDISAVVIDDRDAYFADSQAVKRVPIAGGPVNTLASIAATSLAIVQRHLYIAAESGVYVVSESGEDLKRISASGGSFATPCGATACWLSGPAVDSTLLRSSESLDPTILAEGIPEPHSLVFDGRNFFVAADRGVIYRVPTEGGTPLVVHLEQGTTNLALGPLCLYWSSATTISRVSRSSADVATGS